MKKTVKITEEIKPERSRNNLETETWGVTSEGHKYKISYEKEPEDVHRKL